MILIADSGSTKTDWYSPAQRIVTKGINPVFQTEEEMSREIETALLPQLQTREFDAVHFYGAGCAFPDKVEAVRRVLRRHLRVKGDVEVESDMLAAARALCGHSAGIVCILGTGSNSCYYDGERIVSNVSPLGFILGDEGSGAVLGKRLVGDILKDQTPPELKEKFLAQYRLTPAEIIERVYRRPFPNRFLAGFSPFLAENIHEPCIHALVLDGFKSFFQRNVMQYAQAPLSKVHFVGSIAYHYKAILVEAAAESGIDLGTILQSPMERLVEYHQQERAVSLQGENHR